MSDRKIFAEEFVTDVFSIIEDECSDGSCITAKVLAVKVGEEEGDSLMITQLVKRHLLDVIRVQMGPGGGFHLKSLPLKAKEKKPSVRVTRKQYDESFLLKVKKELDLYFTDRKRNVCNTGYLAGQMDLDPIAGMKDISAVVRADMIKGYAHKSGVGIVPVSNVRDFD